MQVIFVGGASGVGASCLAVEMGEQWFVIDAGVRVGGQGDPLPDLALLEGKEVRAIFVTHAHADHIGSLPLLHRAFPLAPIYASRATCLLMEVMLADAISIMQKRAQEEMEIPLYRPELVASMLSMVRTLPVGETVTLPELAGVTIHASRAGHIAGAFSLSLQAADGSLVVSGDISITPQRTVLGAQPPPIPERGCDLLVLESTYGSRLHPNRESEEHRLAQAVAERIAQGGHVLIPSFALGRGQEILLILKAAQEKGQIPDFPIVVDGLVRRVCNAYQMLSEALSPVLQRQLRREYLPFAGSSIQFIRDERHREQILAGPPACIISSSGMLTGGPSAWYAQRLAPGAQHAIFITGYQDEESPGRKLLDLAEMKNDSLQINGAQIPVRCLVQKYSLSAHADGGELAAYAAALKPRTIALVHGDLEARAALRGLLIGSEVLLPENGQNLTPAPARAKRSRELAQAKVLATLPTGISQGRELTAAALSEIWGVVSQVPGMRIVAARELAAIWFGLAGEAETTEILTLLEQDYEQRYFVSQHAMSEAYRVRGQHEEEPGDALSDLIGKVLLMRIAPDTTKPVVALGLEPGARIRVLHPRGVDAVRFIYPLSAILDLIGELPVEIQGNRQKMAEALDVLVRQSRRRRRRLSAHKLAQALSEGATYTLSELCQLAGVLASVLDDRLAIAKIMAKRPLLFEQRRGILEGEGLSLYTLAPEWREALAETEEAPKADQAWLLSLVQQHLGDASDLYRRSIDPETGAITLAFHFPVVASRKYATQLVALANEADVPVEVAPGAHQGELIRLAQRLLPQPLELIGFPSLHVESQRVEMVARGRADGEAIEAAQQVFFDWTGWYLIIRLQTEKPMAGQAATARQKPVLMDQNAAVNAAQSGLRDLPDFVRAGADPGRRVLLIRFHFPSVARLRHAGLITQIEQRTGWRVEIPAVVHQEALAAMVLRVLPAGLQIQGAPSIYSQRATVAVVCRGVASQGEIQTAQQQFTDETGWHISIKV